MPIFERSIPDKHDPSEGSKQKSDEHMLQKIKNILIKGLNNTHSRLPIPIFYKVTTEMITLPWHTPHPPHSSQPQ